MDALTNVRSPMPPTRCNWIWASRSTIRY